MEMLDNYTGTSMLTNSGEIQFMENIVILNTDFAWTFPNISLYVFTNVLVLSVNLAVLLWVKVKERVLVDRMVTMDCISNILLLIMVSTALLWRLRSNNIVCAGVSFFRGYTLTLNRWETFKISGFQTDYDLKIFNKYFVVIYFDLTELTSRTKY